MFPDWDCTACLSLHGRWLLQQFGAIVSVNDLNCPRSSPDSPVIQWSRQKLFRSRFNQNNLHYFRLIRVYTAMNTFRRPPGTVFVFWWHQTQQQWKTACHLGRKHRGGRGVGSGVACSRAEGRCVTQLRKQDIWLQEPRHWCGRFHCSILDRSTVQNQLEKPQSEDTNATRKCLQFLHRQKSYNSHYKKCKLKEKPTKYERNKQTIHVANNATKIQEWETETF